MQPYSIHVGSLIRVELSRQHKSVSWLAEQLGIQRPNCYRLLNASSIHTETLFLVSQVLRHDFFVEYSAQLIQVLTSKSVSL